jgi:hypothetical protein
VESPDRLNVIKNFSPPKQSACRTPAYRASALGKPKRSAVRNAGALRLPCCAFGMASTVGVLVLTILVAVGAYGQEGDRYGSSHSTEVGYSTGFIFVSPNTSSGLTLKSAVLNLRGRAEVGLILGARDLLCRIGTPGRLTPVIGSWSDGVENSMMIRGRLDQERVRYVSSILGKIANQKSVLYFKSQSGGPATLYVLRIRKKHVGLRFISAALEANGITFRTIAPSRNWTVIYLVDIKSDLGRRVTASARRLHASFLAIKGASEFIGSEVSLTEAQQAYNGVINEFETLHPQVKTPCRIRNKGKGN